MIKLGMQWAYGINITYLRKQIRSKPCNSHNGTACPLFNVCREIWIILYNFPDLPICQQQFVHLEFSLYFGGRRVNGHKYFEHLKCIVIVN